MLRHPLESELISFWPLEKWADVKTVVAVSGGADSVALLRALSAIRNSVSREFDDGDRKIDLTVAHFNHRLRGEESNDDEAFVIALCKQLGLTAITGSAEPGKIELEKSRIGIESAARENRYKFLRKTAESIGARYIFTAHTADDQAETVLHNICRGTGLRGLAGIPFSRSISEAVTLIRPLLRVTRSEILAYLEDVGQLYQSDSSNRSSEFTRNRIRHEVLPLLEQQVNSATRRHLCQLAEIASSTNEHLDQQLQHLGDVVIEQSQKMIRLDRRQLKSNSELVVIHFLKQLWRDQGWSMRDFSSQHVQCLMSAISGEDNKRGNLPRDMLFESTESEIRIILRPQKSRVN